MPINWIGKWAVDGGDKLLKLSHGQGFIRDGATAAEEEFYKEILRLRGRVANAVHALDSFDSSMSDEAIAEALRQLKRTD